MKLIGFNLAAAREIATKTLEQAAAVEEVLAAGLPGEFAFCPPDNNRVVVHTLSELHEARQKLRKLYGWEDSLTNKFASGGLIIATYEPYKSTVFCLPLPFSLWISAPPESFPLEILGNCRIETRQSTDYTVVCPI